jgi:hypothetical protein
MNVSVNDVSTLGASRVLFQHLCDGWMSQARRDIAGSLALLVYEVSIRARIDESLDHLDMSGTRRDHEGGVTLIVLGIVQGAPHQEVPHNFVQSSLRGQDQGCVAGRSAALDVLFAAEQIRGCLGVPVLQRDV